MTSAQLTNSSTPQQAVKPVRIAVLGAGTVGTEVVRILVEQDQELAARIGAPVELSGIGVRNISAERDPIINRSLLTADLDSLVTSADIVVEVMGGIEPARTLILAAIAAGASVVTANKALLAQHGPEIYAAADQAGVDIYYEAAVAGAIPLVRPVRESLAGDRVTRVLGIVNGTTNYILDEMTTRGLDFDSALGQAQELGYAEADPTADIEGHDAAAKAAILASLAFHTRVPLSAVHCEGITGITADDVLWAQRTDRVIKLLAVAEQTAAGVLVRVHPVAVAKSHPLAGVHGAFNAVFVEAEAAGELMFYGRGAGGAPTASAVLGDTVAAARNRVLGGKGPSESAYADRPLLSVDQAQTNYQIRLDVLDKPGVLAAIAGVFAQRDISIEQMRQEQNGGITELVITTHSGADRALRDTIIALEQLEAVRAVIAAIRVEG